jgi:hypothetical protein
MTTVDDIEKAVAELPPKELAAFRAWFEAFEAVRFDEAMERDAAAGKLDRLAVEALMDYREGRSRAFVRHYASRACSAAPSFRDGRRPDPESRTA